MTNILLIEDDGEVQHMLRTWLNDQGHAVHLANNGREGTVKFSTYPIDLVITDIFMGEKDGIETIKEIRQLDPDVPIVAISGGFKNQPFDLLTIAKRLGAAYVFPKPFSLKELHHAIDDCLNRSLPVKTRES